MNKDTRVAIEIAVPTAIFSALAIIPIHDGLMPWWMILVIFGGSVYIQVLYKNNICTWENNSGGEAAFIAFFMSLLMGMSIPILLTLSKKGVLPTPIPEWVWWIYGGEVFFSIIWTTWSLRDIKTKTVLIEGYRYTSRYLKVVQMEDFARGELLLIPRDGLEVTAWEVRTFHSVSVGYSWVVFYQDEFVKEPVLKVKMTIRTESLRPGMLFLKEKEILRRGKEVFWEKRDPGLLERIHQGAWVDEISTKESLPPVLKKDGAEIPVRWSVEAIY